MGNLVLDLPSLVGFIGRVLDKKKEMEDLYLSFKERIYSFLLKYTKNPETAMDLLQDTFVSFFQSYGNSTINKEEAGALLFKIARNRSINYSKKFSTHKELPGVPMDFHPDNRNFEAQMMQQDMEFQLRTLLEELPAVEKDAVYFRFIEELSLAEISQILGTSISSVSRILAKATNRLLELAKKKGVE